VGASVAIGLLGGFVVVARVSCGRVIGPRAGIADLALLRAKKLVPPVEGMTKAALRASFDDPRGGRVHGALDIFAPRGTRVRAVDNGQVAKLMGGARGGRSLYLVDATGAYSYYYAHLDAYADGLADGAVVAKGALLGYVGTTGNAPPHAPHLHFAIFKLGPERRFWTGTPVDPVLVFGEAAGP
jgi:murein DD-endopeptidase MepM/ murein hydrolase activator NlpD